MLSADRHRGALIVVKPTRIALLLVETPFRSTGVPRRRGSNPGSGISDSGISDSRISGLDLNAAKPIVRAAEYVVNNTRLMHYDCALSEGLPIATGVIEGACRYLVQDRMGRTGAVWSAAGAEAVLRLRALRTSGDFDDYWQFHLTKEHERTHKSRYANGDVPNPIPASRPHLKLVK